MVSDYAKKYNAPHKTIGSTISKAVRTEKFGIIEDIKKNAKIVANIESLKNYFQGKYSLWSKRSSNVKIFDQMVQKHGEITPKEWKMTLRLIKDSLSPEKLKPIFGSAKKSKHSVLDQIHGDETKNEEEEESEDESEKESELEENEESEEEEKEAEEAEEKSDDDDKLLLKQKKSSKSSKSSKSPKIPKTSKVSKKLVPTKSSQKAGKGNGQ